MSNIIDCVVLSEYSNSKNRGKIFRKGDKIKVVLVKGSMNTKNPLYKTTDGFIVPQSFLKAIQNNYSNSNGDEEGYAEIVEDEPMVVKLPENFKPKMPEIFKNKSKNAVNGALVGLILGFGFSMYKQKSKLLYSALGSIVGFALGNVYTSYMNNTEEE